MHFKWSFWMVKCCYYVVFRYSIWLDSKLRLQLDPLLILEYFLWRKGHEYAISNHYDRHCVWEEVAQNKKLNKYNHTVIDEQFQFYQNDGLKRFNASDPNKLLPSSKILFLVCFWNLSASASGMILIECFLGYWQMYLKGPSLYELTRLCQTCFLVFGLMRSIDLLLVISWVSHTRIISWGGQTQKNHFI